jgi:hypothetical protein
VRDGSAEIFNGGERKYGVMVEMYKRCAFSVLKIWFIELSLLHGITKLNIQVPLKSEEEEEKS